MDKIVEFINRETNNKYQNLLFFGADLSKKNSAMQLNFYIDNKNLKTKQNVAELEVLCKKYVGQYAKKIVVKFESSALTMEEFKNAVFSVAEDMLNLSTSDLKKVEFDFDSEDFVKVKLPQKIIDTEDKTFDEIWAEAQEEMSQKTHQTIQLEFFENQIKNTAVLENRKSQLLEDNYIFGEMNKAQSIELKNVTSVVGNFTRAVASLVGSNLDDAIDGEVAVVGYVKDFSVREMKPKNVEDSEADKSVKKFLSVELEYDNSVIRAVWFIPKDFGDIPEFTIGESLAICGKLSEYRAEISIRTSSIARCEFEPPKKVWRKCPVEYRYVFPEKYEFSTQMGLFFDEQSTTKDYLKNNSFVIYDLETTGINPETCKIIDIGAFKIVNGKIVERFSTFVNPECEIPEEASKVNRITNDLVKDAPTIEMALPDFYKFCYGSVIAGYNNIGFDDLFIAKEGKKQYYNFDNKRDDVIRIARANVPSLSNYKLSTVCKALDVPLVDAHRATNDALATAKLFIKLVEKYFD